MSNKSKAIIAILIYSLIAGAIPSITKIALLKIPTFSFSFLRFFVSAFCLLPFFIKVKIKIDRDFKKLLLISFLPILNVALFVVGVKMTTASISQLLYAVTTILTGLFGYIIFRNKLSTKRWIFILIGLIGVSLVIFLPRIEKSVLSAGTVEGNIIILAGVIFWALYGVLSKEFQKKYSPIVITSVFVFLATFVFFLLSIPEFLNDSTWLASLNTTSIFAILYISIFATVGSYLLNQYAIKYSNPVVASVSFYVAPIFGYVAAYFLLGEQLTTGLIIGTVIVFLSVALMTNSKNER